MLGNIQQTFSPVYRGKYRALNQKLKPDPGHPPFFQDASSVDVFMNILILNEGESMSSTLILLLGRNSF